MSRTTQDTLTTREMATSARAKELGICTTCNCAPECVNLKAAGRPIWFCDQFDAFVPAAAPNPRAADLSPEPAMATNGGHEGLCQNCDNRQTCINRVPGLAVWNCEEHC
jgi:hypothetical protein